MTPPEAHDAFGLFKNEGPGRDVMLAAQKRTASGALSPGRRLF